MEKGVLVYMFIVPNPQSMTCYDGCYEIEKLKVSGNIESSILKDMEFFGLDIQYAENDINLFFNIDPDLKNEEYEIFVDKGGIKLYYSTPCGCFRALSTLRQIMAQAEDNKIPYLKIHDFPDIETRGMMFVVNSKERYKIDTLHYLIDRMAEVKYNMLQLYIDSFVFEFDGFEKHLEGKGYYTKEEIHSLDEYCKERHIDLTANIETFGHLQELLAIDEFKHLAITRDDGVAFTINPLLDESFEVIKKLLDGLLPHFSTPLVNIGMDETLGIGKHETEEYCRAFGTGGLFVDFLKKVSGHIKDKHSKRSMIWGDMVAKNPRCISDIPKDVIFVDWGYEPGHKFDENARLCKEAGLDYYVAPGSLAWGSFTGRSELMIQNIFFASESARTHGASGFLLTEWNPIRTTTLSLLPYCFGGAFSWNSGYAENISEADNESNSFFRNEVVGNVIKYFDEFILKSKAESCGELVYRMGNYFINEQPDSSSTWNGTLLYKEFMNVDEGYAHLSVGKVKRIYNYMKEIKEELSCCILEAENKDVIMKELLCGCQLVMLAALTLLVEKGAEVTEDIKAFRDETLNLYETLGEIHCDVKAEHPVTTRMKKI